MSDFIPLRKKFAILPLTLLFLASCGGKTKPVPSDELRNPEERAIYELVGTPCSEGDYDTAIARADSLLATSELSDSLRAFIMIDRNVATLDKGDYERGIPATDSLIDFGKKKGIGLAVMQGLQNRGIMKRRLEDHEGAIEDYTEGMETAIREGDKVMEQIFTEMLAILCTERGRYDESMRLCSQSLRLSREIGDTLTSVSVASTLGAILARQGKYEEAIDTLRQFRPLLDSIRPLFKIKYLTPLLTSYLALDSLDQARKLLEVAEEAVAPYPDSAQAQLVVVNSSAELARKEGKFAEQWRWLLKADSIGTMGSAPETLYKVRAECLARLGRYDEAFEMESKAYAALESAKKAQTDANLSELTVKYETLQKEIEIERLKTSKLTWTIIALACIVVLGAVVLFLAGYRRKARRRLEREREQEYIRGLEQERQRMARELHDDIAGSLIGLQWEMGSLAAGETASRIREIGRRVRSLSHELMPPEFSRQPLTSLLLDLAMRFNLTHKTTRIILTDEGSFDWDALPPEKSHELYRIVQESVNNAIKHGTPGDIRITLDGQDRFSLSIENPVAQSGPDGHEDFRLRTLKARAAILEASVEASRRDGMFKLTIRQNR